MEFGATGDTSPTGPGRHGPRPAVLTVRLALPLLVTFQSCDLMVCCDWHATLVCISNHNVEVNSASNKEFALTKGDHGFDCVISW